MGGKPPREVGACAPLTKSCGGGRGSSALGWAQKRPPSGGLRKRRCAPRRHHARVAEASGSMVVATQAATTAPVEPSRK
jgi:hypothetical protein